VCRSHAWLTARWIPATDASGLPYLVTGDGNHFGYLINSTPEERATASAEPPAGGRIMLEFRTGEHGVGFAQDGLSGHRDWQRRVDMMRTSSVRWTRKTF
jgi:hypothetical protein